MLQLFGFKHKPTKYFKMKNKYFFSKKKNIDSKCYVENKVCMQQDSQLESQLLIKCKSIHTPLKIQPTASFHFHSSHWSNFFV